MPCFVKGLVLLAAACLLSSCSAQSGVNTTYYLDANCSAACSNCTVSNPIITAGGCVRERSDVNSSSVTTACNATHVIGSSYNSPNCSGTPVSFAHEVGVCRLIPSSNATLPGSLYARSKCPAQPTFTSLAPRFIELGSQTQLTVAGTNFAAFPSPNCSAVFSLHPSAVLLPFVDCRVSDAGLLHLILPATAPLGSNFTFSVMFSNLAVLVVSMVNMSVVIYPQLQAVVFPTFATAGDTVVVNGSFFNPSLPCKLSYRQNASAVLPLSSCVVVNETSISAVVPFDALPCASCSLAVTFPGYSIELLFGSANVTIAAIPRISIANPVNLPIGTTGTLPTPAIGGFNFPEQTLPCRGTVCNTGLQYCVIRSFDTIDIKLDISTPVCANTSLKIFFDGYASPVTFPVSTVPPSFITGIAPLSDASTRTIVGGNFFALGPCEVHYTLSFGSSPVISSSCNVTSTTSVEFTLAARQPAAAVLGVRFLVYFFPQGKYSSPLQDMNFGFNVIGTLMSAQLDVSPRISRQNTTLFINLFDVTTLYAISFISVSALPPLIHVGSVVCTISGQTVGGSSVTASRPHADHLVLEFASVIAPSPNIVCAVEVQFANGSVSKNISITTDNSTPSRGLSKSTVDASYAVLPPISGMSAQLVVSPRVARQNTTLLINLFDVTSSTAISFISVSALPPLTSVGPAVCTINGQTVAGRNMTASRPHHDHLVLEFASVITRSPNIECAVEVQFTGGSAATVVCITTDISTPSRGFSNTTVDASYAVLPPISGMSASMTIGLPSAGQQTATLALSLSGLTAAASIRSIAIASLPLFSSPSNVTCTINGAMFAPVAFVSQPGTLVLQLAAPAILNSSSLACALSLLFNPTGSSAKLVRVSIFADTSLNPNATIDENSALLPPVLSALSGSFSVSSIIRSEAVILTLEASRTDSQPFTGVGPGSVISVNLAPAGISCLPSTSVVVAGQSARVLAIAAFGSGVLNISISQGTFTSSSFSVAITGCTNPARVQAALASVILAISDNSTSTSTMTSYGAQFTFPPIVIGISVAAIFAPVATTSSRTTLNFTITVDASFYTLKVAVSDSFILPAVSGTLDCSVPASTTGTWTAVSSSGPTCSPFGGGSCSYVTLSLSSAVAPGQFVCAITGVTTSSTPALPVTAVKYPLFLYDNLGKEVAASYSASLTGISLSNFSPRPQALLILTVRPFPTVPFTAEAFRTGLAVFLSCSPLQITISSVVTQTGISFIKSLSIFELSGQHALPRAAGDVSLTVTLADSPFVLSIAPAILLQNVTIAFASNSSNPLFVSLGIVALKVSDPAADAAAAEAAAKNEALLIIGVSVAVAVVVVMMYVFYRLGRGIVHRYCKCCRTAEEEEDALFAGAEASVTGGRPSRGRKRFEMA